MKKDVRILLVEDEPNFGVVLKGYLELTGYQVDWCRDGEAGAKSFQRDKYDLCILDVMMPKMDGFSLARLIREKDQQVPLVFLTARGMKEDMLEGFRLGGDDYLVKPFDSEVLLYKVQALLKRKDWKPAVSEEIHRYQIGRYTFEPALRTLTIGSEARKLSPKESDLLRLLCEYMQQVMPRELALRQIWNDDNYFTGRSMDVYIARLRKYLKEDEQVSIDNIHGNGFRLLVAVGEG